MFPSIVPRIQAKVLSTEIVASNPKLVELLSHPAGPFTGTRERSCPYMCMSGLYVY